MGTAVTKQMRETVAFGLKAPHLVPSPNLNSAPIQGTRDVTHFPPGGCLVNEPTAVPAL